MTDELDVLARTDVLAGLEAAAIRDVYAAGKRIRYEPGEPISVEGTPVRRFFVVLEGTARVDVHGSPRGVLGPATSFGEVALLDHGTRTANVVAETPVSTLAVPAVGFRRLLIAYPSLVDNLLVRLAGLLRTERSVSDGEP